MSLSSRIIARITLTTLLAAAAGYGWLYVKQSHVETYLRERSLVRQAEEISSFISVDPSGSVKVDLPPQLLEGYNSPGSRYRYAIRDEAGRIVMTSGRRIGPLPYITAPATHHSYAYENGEGARTIGAAYRKVIGQRTFVTQVEQIAPKVQSLGAAVFNEFFADGGWLGIPFLVALLCISALTVRRALAPLQALSVLAAKIDPGNSDVRLPYAGVPEEMLPLVRSVNSALDRLDDGLRRQREFNANAAHQLRTPLAVLSANIDALEDKEIAGKLRYDVEAMTRIVSQLLLVAKLETLDVRLDEPVDLCAVAREVAENLGLIAVSNGKTLEVEAPKGSVLVPGNRFVVGVAISNLVENALHHTPAGGLVRVRVTATPSVEVRDSGPGIPPTIRERVFERFWKGEASKHGTGLGLSIVRRVMSAIHGSVAISDAPEGGAQFTLHFNKGALAA
jgi:signal transduction histidine kinase